MSASVGRSRIRRHPWTGPPPGIGRPPLRVTAAEGWRARKGKVPRHPRRELFAAPGGISRVPHRRGGAPFRRDRRIRPAAGV